MIEMLSLERVGNFNFAKYIERMFFARSRILNKIKLRNEIQLSLLGEKNINIINNLSG